MPSHCSVESLKIIFLKTLAKFPKKIFHATCTQAPYHLLNLALFLSSVCIFLFIVQVVLKSTYVDFFKSGEVKLCLTNLHT